MQLTSTHFLKKIFEDELIFKLNETLLVSQESASQEVQAESNTHPDLAAVPAVELEVALPKPVPAASPATLPSPEHPPKESTLGRFKQKVLLIVNDSTHAVLNDIDREFLEKVLGAVELRLEDVDLLNIATLNTADLKSHLNSKSLHHLITFGVPLTRLRLEILLVPYQIKQVEGVNLLFADTLASIQQDRARKSAFWGCLKKMFDIK